MNEIEKMYENAGLDNLWVERYNDGNGFEHENWYPSYKVMIKSMMEKNGWTLTEAQNVAKKECRKEHPPFTTEKQLELIKWLSDTNYYIHSIYKTIDTKEYCIENDFYDIQMNKFEEALARLINKLWQDLTEEDKQQVKGILE